MTFKSPNSVKSLKIMDEPSVPFEMVPETKSLETRHVEAKKQDEASTEMPTATPSRIPEAQVGIGKNPTTEIKDSKDPLALMAAVAMTELFGKPSDAAEATASEPPLATDESDHDTKETASDDDETVPLKPLKKRKLDDQAIVAVSPETTFEQLRDSKRPRSSPADSPVTRRLESGHSSPVTMLGKPQQYSLAPGPPRGDHYQPPTYQHRPTSVFSHHSLAAGPPPSRSPSHSHYGFYPSTPQHARNMHPHTHYAHNAPPPMYANCYENAIKTSGLPKSLSFRKVCSKCGKVRGEHGELGFGNKCVFEECGKCGAGQDAHTKANKTMGILCNLTVEEGAVPGASVTYERKIRELAARAELQKSLALDKRERAERLAQLSTAAPAV
jgi:hypothetical protein